MRIECTRSFDDSKPTLLLLGRDCSLMGSHTSELAGNQRTKTSQEIRSVDGERLHKPWFFCLWMGPDGGYPKRVAARSSREEGHLYL